MAMRPLHTTLAVHAVQRAEATVVKAIADGVIDLCEQRAIRRVLSEAEGIARHADNCGRFAMAVMRDTNDVVYLETLRMKAGAPEFEPLDAA